MSKSLRNYPDVSEVLDRDGSDAMRWFLMSSPILRGGNLVVTEQGIRDGVRQVILPLWNVYSFFTLYTNAADGAGGAKGYDAKLRYDGYADTLDQYLLANTGDLVRNMTAQLDSYDISGACDELRSYLDMLTNWYVRRSRQRFFDESVDAFDALYTALETGLPRGRVPAAAGLRGDLARPHRRALRAPGRLAGRGPVPGQPGPGGGDGPRAADLLHRLLAAQGREPARAPAAAGTHGRGTRRGCAGRLRRRRRR